MTVATGAGAPTHHQAPSRPVVDVVHPVVDEGRYLAAASTVEPVIVEADVFADGHGRLGAMVMFRHERTGRQVFGQMTEGTNDRWRAEVRLPDLGRWTFVVCAWIDEWEYWRRSFISRQAADLDLRSDLLDGADLLRRALDGTDHLGDRPLLERSLREIERADASVAQDDLVAAAMARWAATRPGTTTSPEFGVEVARERAVTSSWYELFPRSVERPAIGHGTFAELEDRLPHIAELGFDVVYLPPIHPIGFTARKGRNNSLTATPDDPGSPWAIGSSAGGHTAVHPELGTLDDFDSVVRRARELGLEIALDLAYQCSPDHPWVAEHPSWFRHRADGSIRTAENPPKRYEDIFPIDFTCDDWEALWDALAGVVRHWMAHGVRIFRVDNPHTKPFAFWEWLIGDIRSTDPDVIFLAEAFTRPRVLERLAKIGFDQSYGYFTWKRSGWELREYFEDASERTSDFLRINVWPNTPDILTDQLQTGGRAMFETRAVLAATLSANWGVYGPTFELLVGEAVRPGSEEYERSEKYEVRQWDLGGESIAPLLRQLNRIRATHPALRSDRDRVFHDADDPELLCWSKGRADDAVIVVVNVAADRLRSGMVHLDLDALGLDDDVDFDVRDLLNGNVYRWHGAHNYVALGVDGPPAHVFEVVR
ncbi:MAG: maltotransferase domain-containing protein [Acidimicrobiales bacterium]